MGGNNGMCGDGNMMGNGMMGGGDMNQGMGMGGNNMGMGGNMGNNQNFPGDGGQFGNSGANSHINDVSNTSTKRSGFMTFAEKEIVFFYVLCITNENIHSYFFVDNLP